MHGESDEEAGSRRRLLPFMLVSLALVGCVDLAERPPAEIPPFVPGPPTGPTVTSPEGDRFIFVLEQRRRIRHDGIEPSLVEGGTLVNESDEGLIVGWWMGRPGCYWVSSADAVESDEVVDVEIYVQPPGETRPEIDCEEQFPVAVQVRLSAPLGTRQLLIGGVPAD